MVRKPLSPVMEQYLSLKEGHDDCLLFFRMGDFYELFFEDAERASKALDIALTKRGKTEEGAIPMCGVPVESSDGHVAKLVQQGFRIAVCEQMETPKEHVGAGPLKREVVRVVTPGTLVEEALLNAKRNAYLLAVFPERGKLGLAVADLSTGAFWTETVEESAWEHTLHVLCPTEILVPATWTGTTGTALRTIVSNDRLESMNPERVLRETFALKTLEGLDLLSKLEQTAAAMAVAYVRFTQKSLFPSLTPPKSRTQKHALEIDAWTMRNLELAQTLSGKFEGSLLWAIDGTVTAAGGRLLFSRLMQPLLRPEDINARLDRVSFFTNQAETRQKLRKTLEVWPDVERILARLALRRPTPRDLAALRDGLAALPFLSANSEIPFDVHTTLAQTLQNAVAQDLPVFLKEGGVVANGFDAELDRHRRLHAHGNEATRALQERYISETGIPTLKVRRNDVMGYFIEIPTSQVSKVPYTFLLRQTLVGGHRYVTSELMELERRLTEAHENALQREKELLDALIREILREQTELRTTAEHVADLDVASALADVADRYKYTRPMVDGSTAFSVDNGRHPVVEKHLRAKETAFVGNGCVLEGAQRAWVLTGPNMAGKSTFLRQNALMVILSQMGSFVPADRAHLGVVDRVFSRIGAHDDLSQGHSTFMKEMIETALIMNRATERSFVVVDELGRGTAPSEGLAIAYACLEHLVQTVGSRVLFSTHHHELAHVSLPSLAPYTMDLRLEMDHVVFLHNVVPGVTKRAFALQVAKTAGMPESILERARTWILQS